MIKRILVAYDGSQPADKAYALALDLAAKYSADLLVISIARPPEPADDVETEAVLENAQEHYEQLFVSLREKAAALGINPHFQVAVGHPTEQIIMLAEQKDVNFIVMGHRGKGFFQRLLIGSISKQVINHAHCAVTIVR